VDGHREQTLLRPGTSDEIPDVEKRLVPGSSVDEDANLTAFLDDIEPVRLGPGSADPPHASQAGGERSKASLIRIGLAGGQRHRDRAG
jgi:hypothetical protein